MFNEKESKYDFSVPGVVKFAAHAIALNEYRGGLANFNARSILDNPSQTSTSARVEKGFLGAHADIGGGYGTGDLSDVALMWMIKQATDQGIAINTKKVNDNGWNVVTSPLIHDSSSNLINGAPTGGPQPFGMDRNFIYANGTTVKQRKVTSATMQYADTVPLITYKPNPNASDLISGTVDAKAYIAWLNAHGYNVGVTAP